MGFHQNKASHHFHLTRDGGSIELSVKEAADEVTLKQVRNHLKTISKQFADGVFTAPMMTHGEEPAGIAVMRERKALIKYSYEETPSGGRVVISTNDATARAAIHDFLKYQIREHKTGDPMTPES